MPLGGCRVAALHEELVLLGEAQVDALRSHEELFHTVLHASLLTGV